MKRKFEEKKRKSGISHLKTMKRKSEEKKRKFGISHLKTPKWLCILRETLPRKYPTAVSKRKFQEKKSKFGISHLKTPKATSLCGSVSNSAEVRQKTLEDSQVENVQKECNASLSLQLNKSKKENVEFKSFIQKLEETIQQEKSGMMKLEDLAACEDCKWFYNPFSKDYMERIVSCSWRNDQLLAIIRKEEKKLEKIEKSKHWKKISNTKLLYERKLDVGEREISSLKARLSESVPETCNAEAVGDADLLGQIQELKEKDHEHEMWEMNPKNVAVEDELKFQEESNANLSLQLNKIQEENVGLVSVIQERRDTIVNQILDMEKPGMKTVWLIKIENEIFRNYMDSGYAEGRDLYAEMMKLKEKVKETEVIEDAQYRKKKNSEIEMDYDKKYRAQVKEILRLEAKLENVTC